LAVGGSEWHAGAGGVKAQNLEGLLLTGGQSRRMGTDKASLVVDGEAVAVRTAKKLAEAVSLVTVLGNEPIAGFGFQPDASEFEGPLYALAGYEPQSEAVFVVGCDMPRFDPKIVEVLSSSLRASPDSDAAVPVLEGRRQPLCALYRSPAWQSLHRVVAEGRRSLMAWLDALNVLEIAEAEFGEAELDPRDFRSANTPEEWQQITGIDLS